MPSWVEHALWWHVYPLGFVGAEASAVPGQPVAHRLAHLQGWLDYAVELGASGLALGPVFAAETHGYDTVDHFTVDPRLGDDADLDALVAAAHERGLKVLLDGVFHHVGRGHPAFQQVLTEGPGAPTAGWFRLRWHDGVPDADVFEGHASLVALDHDSPAVADLVCDVMAHWLARGADGWRLDAAYAVPPRFWAGVLPRVRAAHPEAWFVGEVLHGDYARFVDDSTVDSVTQYELWKAVWSSLNDRNLFELAHALERHNGWLDRFVPLTFLGNHDVTRLASQVRDERHLPHALVALLTVAGTPSVYAGDEQAFRGVKEHRAGGDDAVRPAFPATPEGLSPHGWPTYRLHQELIALRRRHPWLHRARTQVVLLANEHLVWRVAGGGQALTVLLNLADAALKAEVSGTLLAGAARPTRRGVEVPAHGWAVLGP